MREEWQVERTELQRILDEITSGKLVLKNGTEAYVESLKRRIEAIDIKLSKKR